MHGDNYSTCVGSEIANWQSRDAQQPACLQGVGGVVIAKYNIWRHIGSAWNRSGMGNKLRGWGTESFCTPSLSLSPPFFLPLPPPSLPPSTPSFCHPSQTYLTHFQNGVSWYKFRNNYTIYRLKAGYEAPSWLPTIGVKIVETLLFFRVHF